MRKASARLAFRHCDVAALESYLIFEIVEFGAEMTLTAVKEFIGEFVARLVQLPQE